MKMINFECMAFFFLLAVALCLTLMIIKHIRYMQLLKLTKIYILRRQQKTDISFYADIIITKCLRQLYFSQSKQAKTALAYLVFGKTDKAENFIAAKDICLSLFLRAHTDAKSAYSRLKRCKNLWQNDVLYSLLFADLAEKFFDFEQIRIIIKKLNKKKIFSLKKAYYNKIIAAVYVKDADMLSASASASAALKFFQKHDMPIEEAEIYLLLGEIYRISCVNDVAQTMLESALKIYQRFLLNLFSARALAILGMLMVFENRSSEAEDKFSNALNLSNSAQLRAEVLNQFALLEISRKNIKKSKRMANEAFLLHQNQKNARGIALSLQILAHLYYLERKHLKSLKCAKKAADFYIKQKNFSAACECLYLEATILYKQKKLKKSEELLRQILQIAERYSGNFHHANAYSLLGLIYWQKNDLQRAKVLFQQSLHLEQRNERTPALVADYINLSLIENLCGNKDMAKTNSQIALEYALKTEDDELINLIKSRI